MVDKKISRTRVNANIRDFSNIKNIDKNDSKFLTYSEDQIDIALFNIFSMLGVEKGFYVDVGANDPNLISNTRFLYDQGWKGISIDAIISNVINHSLERKADLVFNYAITDKSFDCMEMIIPGSVVHTKQESGARLRGDNMGGAASFQFNAFAWRDDTVSINVPTITLNDLFSLVGNVKDIDLITFDIEGGESKAFKGFDMSLYTPKVIVIESNAVSEAHNDTNLGELITSTGYTKVYDSFASPFAWSSNGFYVRNDLISKLDLGALNTSYADHRFVHFYYVFNKSEILLQDRINEVLFARAGQKDIFVFDTDNVKSNYLIVNFNPDEGDKVEFGDICPKACDAKLVVIDDITEQAESSMLNCTFENGHVTHMLFYNTLSSDNELYTCNNYDDNSTSSHYSLNSDL